MAFRSPQFSTVDISSLERVPQIFQAAMHARAQEERAERMAATQEGYERAKFLQLQEQHRANMEREARLRRMEDYGLVKDLYKSAATGQQGLTGLLAAAAGAKVRQRPVQQPGPLPPPPVEPQPGFVGPVQDPAEAAARGPEAATLAQEQASEVDRYQSLLGNYRLQMSERPQLEAAHAREVEAARTTPPELEIELPGGSVHSFSPNEQQQYKLHMDEETASRLLAVATDPSFDGPTRQRAMQVAHLIKSGISNADKAPITNAAAQEQAHANRMELQQAKAELARALKEMSLRKGGGRSGAGHSDLKTLGKKLENENKYDLIAQRVLTNFGYKEAQVANRKFNAMAANLASSSSNSALDAVIAGSFVKMAQGGVGVVSDQDMEVFWSRIGGWAGKSVQVIHDVLDGKIHPEKRAAVAAAVRELAKTAQNNLDEITSAIAERMRDVEGGPEHAETYGRVYGGTKKRPPTLQGAAKGAEVKGLEGAVDKLISSITSKGGR